jgi:nitroreductase/NAD-dependent dihydropyrimidine dehydrogenase PreA subunit
MDLITINRESCINCGMCVEECPCSVLRQGENGPEAVADSHCISCGHCVAICPKKAIDNLNTPLKNQEELKDIQPLSEESARLFLRSRRSVRAFQKTPVPRERLLQLVDIAHYAPTGSNLQGISYLIIDNPEMIQKAVQTEVQWIEANAKSNSQLALFAKIYNQYHVDFILHNAPALVVATSAKEFERGRENTIFSLAYLELYAPSIGLGSCWAGLFERCAMLENSPIRELFQIPENKKITGAVMVGYPKYHFKRMVERNPLEVSFYHEKSR